ncbi:cell division protein [Pandoraea iniqua]|uniref:Peptidoglycan D,D-transpeptidase FtsI n=1 Tax=Pandoraea iniqua TaxID=2508288 RepID=A0A5E4YJR0_9BURK|nr:penicillin-binding protein 2 [Pandoraea iniqua]VVE48660.1 cell division protein [Pandoraea iniqua]VVE51601.1 cell division protein [Pandoraea iniqua]
MIRRKDAKAKTKDVQFSASPVLSVRLPMWRSKMLVFVIFGAFAALAARAFWIQGPGNAFYQRQGESRYERTLEMSATRGKVFDRNGQVLATSLPVKAIWAIPEDVPEDVSTDQVRKLARLLEMGEPDLRRKLGQEKSFVYVKRQVLPDVAKQVADLDIPGIYQRKEYKRFYPEGEIAAHIVGFTNVEDIGQEGVELSMQKDLAATPGSRRVIKDRLGRVVEDLDILAQPRDGHDITLSIDSKIQFLAYSELKDAIERTGAKAGSAVVLDVRTGEVLALVNLPTYNPNNRTNLTGAQLRNRVITDTFEPGSIMKPITVAAAIENGYVKPMTTVMTTGRANFFGATITDTRDYGLLTVQGVIQHSSNIGTAKIALQMKSQEMWDMFTSVGLGQAPKIGFPGAVAGRLRPAKSWRPIEQATMGYGYGLSASLIQLARAYTVFAHDGELLPISIYKTDGSTVKGTPVISPATAREVRKMLEMVTSPGGTATRAQVIGYRVGGKTGTAYKQSGKGYDKSKYRASFVGMAPMSEPRIIVAVTLDEPGRGAHYGGVAAGPAFAAIVGGTLRSLNVVPDSPVTKLVVSDAVEESEPWAP